MKQKLARKFCPILCLAILIASFAAQPASAEPHHRRIPAARMIAIYADAAHDSDRYLEEYRNGQLSDSDLLWLLRGSVDTAKIAVLAQYAQMFNDQDVAYRAYERDAPLVDLERYADRLARGELNSEEFISLEKGLLDLEKMRELAEGNLTARADKHGVERFF